MEVVGGRYKGRVYGIGNVSARDDCVDSYVQQKQTSSSQQPIVQNISNLENIVLSHDQQIRLTTSKFEGFIGAIMHYLPSPTTVAAQEFLQSQIQPQTNVQQPQQPQEDQPQQNQPQHPTEHEDRYQQHY